MISAETSKLTTFHSVVESKREEFRNLKQGSMSVYQYNTQFQKLARLLSKTSLMKRA